MKIAIKRKIERQPKAACIQPPRMGASAGARPKTIGDIGHHALGLRARESGRAMIARPTTLPAPAESPCSSRKNISQPKLSGKSRADRADQVEDQRAENHRPAPERIGERAVK